MARPPSIKDEAIVSAARELFLERGIRATTAEVAERAGISEGSIFNRFRGKVELFEAAMRQKLDEPPWACRLDARVGRGSIDAELVELGLEIVDFFRVVMPLMMMSWSNPAPGALDARFVGEGTDAPEPGEAPPLEPLARLAAYFEAEMRLGRVRRADPEVLARTFLGGLHSYVFFDVLLRLRSESSLTADAFVKAHVHLLSHGIAPRAGSPQAP